MVSLLQWWFLRSWIVSITFAERESQEEQAWHAKVSGFQLISSRVIHLPRIRHAACVVNQVQPGRMRDEGMHHLNTSGPAEPTLEFQSASQFFPEQNIIG